MTEIDTRFSEPGATATDWEGLVLLVSVAFALAVVRLGQRGVLVQQLLAVETLARVDVVCMDKTGTLTDGRHLRVVSVDALDSAVSAADATAALAAVARGGPSPNARVRAVAAAVPLAGGWTPGQVVPFSSGRRWSGAEPGDGRAGRLGATGDQRRSVVNRAERRCSACGLRVSCNSGGRWTRSG